MGGNKRSQNNTTKTGNNPFFDLTVIKIPLIIITFCRPS